MTATGLKTFVRIRSWLMRIGLITAAVIIGFQIIGQWIIYRHLKLDYYLSLVVVSFIRPIGGQAIPNNLFYPPDELNGPGTGRF